MKTLKRFSAVVSAAALLAVAFTGCNNSFAGTELNYAEKESEKVGTTGDLQNLSSATFTVTKDFTANKASNRTSITVVVSNGATSTRVNLASAKEAIDFWAVSSASATTVKNRSAKLTKTLFAESETDTSATFKFEVDTSSIPTSDIAFVVDATKLKDKQGTLILNEDGNHKRGEVTDSHVEYVTVDTTKSAPIGVNEDFSPDAPNGWTPFANNGASVVALVNASDFKYTGEYEVQITPASYRKASATDTPAVNKDLAATLNSIVALRTREAGSTSTSTKALSFSWSETKNCYIASAGNLAAGTHYDLVITKTDISSIAPAWYKDYYGHPAFVSEDGLGSKLAAAAGVASVYLTSPDYIIEGYSATASTWNPIQRTATNIAAAQQSYFTVTRSGRVFSVVPTDNEKLEFESYKDFIVVDTSADGVEYKLPIEYRVKFNDGDNANPSRVARLEIEITNKNITLRSPKLYVGSGVVLKNNPTNPTQKKFGAFKDAAEGITSGYVALN